MKMKFVFILCVILAICSSVEGWRRRRFRVRTRRWFSRRSRVGLKESACSSSCPSNYSPVCGSNGKTYGNKCTFNLAKCRVGKLSKSKSKRMTIAYSGKCKEQSKYKGACSSRCPSNYSPVCGSNGKTYGNKCIFNSAKCRVGKRSKTKSKRMIIAYSGKCKGQSKYKGKVCSRRCSKKYVPVCGSNGVMYSNICLLIVAKCQQKRYGKIGKRLYLVSQRKCKRGACSSRCPSNYSPVCGSNGKTYGNKCIFNSAKCRVGKWSKTKSKRMIIAYSGKCKGQSKYKGKVCSRRCSKKYVPVCGSNGVMYSNICLLMVAKCQQKRYGKIGKRLYLVSQRKCKRGACSSRCPSNYSPVCGSNGKTYGNKCIFNSAKCRVGKWSKTKSKRMIIAYSGKCKGQSKYKGKVCSRRCSKKYVPVCGSNGVMYSNICLLMVAKCQQKRYGKIGKRLYLVSQRKCKRVPKCPSFCRKKVSPICGSNGRSYRNMCYFNSARCQLKKFGQTITVAYYKKCYRKKNRGWIKGLRCRSKCYMYYSPVCGSNGKTYWNMCVFKAARCRINNRGRRLRYAYRGSYRRFWRLRYAYRGRCKRRRHAYRGKCKRGRRVYRGRCKRGRRVYRGRYKRRRPIMTVKTIINMSK